MGQEPEKPFDFLKFWEAVLNTPSFWEILGKINEKKGD